MNTRTATAGLFAGPLAGLLVGIMAGPSGAQDDPSALTTRSGTLAKDGERYAVDGAAVSFGPTWYTAVANAAADYDGDGTVETIAAELDGLVGTAVTLDGETGRCGDFGAFTINGQVYRSAGRPPWAGGPKVVGAIQPGAGAQMDKDDDGGAGRPPWAGTGQGKPCS
jgi:hypothetical protein